MGAISNSSGGGGMTALVGVCTANEATVAPAIAAAEADSLLTAVRGARRRCNARYRNGNFNSEYLGKYSSCQSFACAGTLH